MIPFIIFFGPEGAGKTTQINILARKLKAKYGPRNIEVISIRDNHLLIPIIVKFLKFLGFRAYFRYGDGHVSVVADVPRVVRDKRVWVLIQLLNVLPIYFVRYFLKRKLRKKLLVADRFITDSLCTISHFMQEPNFLTTTIGRLYFSLIPKDAYLIFLYASYETLRARYISRKTPVEPPDLIYYEILVGYAISKLFKHSIMINTSKKSVKDVSRIIDQFLKRFCIL
jgi:energy-coupling factor transporter ATP-binding protein EcfA2